MTPLELFGCCVWAATMTAGMVLAHLELHLLTRERIRAIKARQELRALLRAQMDDEDTR